MHGGIEVICGTHSPEDLELAPDGKHLLVSQFVNNRGVAGPGAGLSLFDPVAKTFTKLTATAEPLKDWGDAACPGPIGEALAPHGTSLRKRANGVVQLFVVNHGGRESIEMFEVKGTGTKTNLVWHGCVVSPQAYNDVAALPDGGFIATHPTALQTPGMNLFDGAPSGYLSRWSSDKGEAELPGTRRGYPNGVIVSADGHYAYMNAWTVREVHKYDLRENKAVAVLKLDFMPDNLTWTNRGRMLAAGIKSPRGLCPPDTGTPCIQTSEVVEIDPMTMTARPVFDSTNYAGPSPIGGTSVALELGKFIYLGSFQGERIVRIAYPK